MQYIERFGAFLFGRKADNQEVPLEKLKQKDVPGVDCDLGSLALELKCPVTGTLKPDGTIVDLTIWKNVGDTFWSEELELYGELGE